MKTILHKADTRGHQNHGWLDTYHTFSFANYYNPERIHFGALRVLNDDFIDRGMGFGTHPHADMEIITIPLDGVLHHKDSMGNSGEIRKGEIQVMSAGTGIQHSEYNGSDTEPVKILQIWVIPNKRGVTPRYDQIEIKTGEKPNDFQQIISPNPNDAGSWIHQDTWFNLGKIEGGQFKTYTLHRETNGVYMFLISGKAKVGDVELSSRDGLGIYDTNDFEIEVTEDAEILLMEVPMR